ncbi:MAG: hypothetical protein USCAAHI_02329 [Beijerinckiaceae bacterium]|jgi:hypothetical protein|nr:MAG: hypothetical protein USCAAHI_02329 [Beijerinckiaceae bacterium]
MREADALMSFVRLTRPGGSLIGAAGAAEVPANRRVPRKSRS